MLKDWLRVAWKAARTIRAKQSAIDMMAASVMDEKSISEDQKGACFDKCLQQLPQSDRDLVLFRFVDKGKELDARRELAQSLGISPNALRVRVHRTRRDLEKCITSCLQHEQDQAHLYKK